MQLKIHQKKIYNFIYPYKHWQNILTILVTELFKKNNSDYKYFLDYEIVRACVSATKGSKNKIEKIKYIKDKYQDNDLYQSLLKVGRELKNHNLVMIVRRYKKDVSNYFIELKDYQINPHKYTGKPQLPKPRKLARLKYYSIPLDNANGIRFKKNRIGINLKDKIRYFYIDKIINNAKVLDKKIQSVAIVMKNQEIYLSFGYTANQAEHKKTQSLIFSGNKYKYYNAKFNRFIAKLNNSVSAEVIAYKTITKAKDKTAVQIPIKWTKKGHKLTRYISFLYRKRADLMNNGKCKLRKKPNKTSSKSRLLNY